MIKETADPTDTFHEIYGTLLDEGTNDAALDHMDSLLHIPKAGPIDWEQNAIRLASMRMISTVTEAEVLGAYHK